MTEFVERLQARKKIPEFDPRGEKFRCGGGHLREGLHLLVGIPCVAE
ncbi:hypothetical protein [Schlesneria sp. T3-172]